MAEIAKDLSVSLLLDFYGEMLTEKQREVISLYYNEDMSLAEIAQHSGITRQGVRDSIKRAERQLFNFEKVLGLYTRFHEIQGKLEAIREHAQAIVEENLKATSSQEIQTQAQLIIEKTREIN